MSLLNNSAILKNKAFRQNFVVTRPAAGAHNETTGVWESTDPEQIDASGSIQPAKASDLQHLQAAMEGGTRITQAVRIYSTFAFRPGVLGVNSANGDSILHNGLQWQVVSISNFAGHGHQKLFGIRTDGQDG